MGAGAPANTGAAGAIHRVAAPIGKINGDTAAGTLIADPVIAVAAGQAIISATAAQRVIAQLAINGFSVVGAYQAVIAGWDEG